MISLGPTDTETRVHVYLICAWDHGILNRPLNTIIEAAA